jgi:hypothetical protein
VLALLALASPLIPTQHWLPTSVYANLSAPRALRGKGHSQRRVVWPGCLAMDVGDSVPPHPGFGVLFCFT